MKNKILIIYGPTGVGKSALAEKIAECVSAEIINMDVGQFYTPLAIGTAKPDYKNSPITHHLFDVVNEPKDFTVTHYRNLVLNTVKKVQQKNKLPILVGGSGFYLKSLFFPPLVSEHNITEIQGTWDDLYTIDPERAKQLEKNDTYRINRALGIYKATGKKPSELVPEFVSIGDFVLIHVNREREQLYDRINKRVLQMVNEGLVQEVEPLMNTDWQTFLQRKKLIGYNEVIDYLLSEKTAKDKQHMIATIQKRTRNYAKRQLTFWRMLREQLEQQTQQKSGSFNAFIESVNLTLTDVDLYIEQSLKRVIQ